MPELTTDAMILRTAHDPRRANEWLEEVYRDPRERTRWLDDRLRVFLVGGRHRDDNEGGGEPGALAAAPAIVGLGDKGRRRYRELTGEDAPGLD